MCKVKENTRKSRIGKMAEIIHTPMVSEQKEEEEASSSDGRWKCGPSECCPLGTQIT
jgi:hypothetical protein